MFKGSKEMAEGWRLKQHLNKTWFKSSRGGKNISSIKDLPWTSQEKEKEGRKSYWKEARGTDEGEKDSSFKWVENTETVVFIPATPGSVLRKKLQEMDYGVTKATNSPTVRIVDRGGPSIVDIIGRTNPLAREWFCPREDCQQCRSRQIISKDMEEKAVRLVDGEESKPDRTPKDNKA